MKYICGLILAVSMVFVAGPAQARPDGWSCTVYWDYTYGDLTCFVEITRGGNYTSKRAASRACWAACEAAYKVSDLNPADAGVLEKLDL